MTKKVLFALMASTAIAIASPALADNSSGGSAGSSAGTPDSANSVESTYKKIIGLMPPNVTNSISVTKDGDATKVTIDFEQLAQPLVASGFKLTAKPVSFTFTPQADGTIRETTDSSYDFGFDFQLPGMTQTGSFTYQGYTFDGIIDPKLVFFREAKGGIAKAFGNVDNRADGSSASIAVGEGKMDLGAEPAGDKAINVHLTESINGLSEKVHVDPSKATVSKSGPPMDFEIKFPVFKEGVSINGIRSIAARDLFLFLLANNKPADIAAKQVEFKRDIRELVPLMSSMDLSGEIDGMAIQTAFGQGQIGKVGLTATLDTNTPSSSVSLGEHFDDIKIDTVFMPEWAKPLVPTSIDLEFGAHGFDLGGLMNKYVDALDKHDFTDPKPDTTDYKALGRDAIMPNDTMQVDLKPSSIVSPVYKINWQGGMEVHRLPNDKADAKAHIDVTASGLDDLIKTLMPVRDKGVPETLIGLYAAKALAKPGPDGTLLWALDIDSQTGSFLVNGKPVGPQQRKL